MRPNTMLATVFFLALFLLPGCDRISGEQLGLLTAGAVAAKERASAFEIIRGGITAAEPQHAAGVQKWSAAHAEGLAAQAKGLNDLVESVRLHNALGDAARQQIALEAETAAARLDGFVKVLPYLMGAGDGTAFKAWAEDHGKALKVQAETLKALALKLQKGKPKP